MNLSPCGATGRQGTDAFSTEGLPPLPRGLSCAANSGGASWRDVHDVPSEGARVQAGDGSATHAHNLLGSLDASLALLQKEMVDLRQLDVSLLCQLCSLHEDVQEFKNSSLLSEALLSADDGYSEGEEEESEVEEEDMAETGVVSQCLPSSSSVSPLGSNTGDQWIKDSFHVP